ncbi:MAG: aminotransferase class III-fold pyridoxal phosphate-dependent enzyme, partial [Gemmatimonadota bacterium]|nr:aminotransferase class III-fold pyridoxal phosphate-dependent enzyme [Gemmatimonadota bacterium]
MKRFFGRARDAAPAASADEPETGNASDSDDETGDAEAVPEEAPERSWRERADAVLPTGASTGSKRAEALYGRAEADGPTHFVSASGCRVTDTAGASYLDCTMALGAVALGYAEPRVTQAVIEAAAQGNVAGFSSWREVELAERLCALIPCAERAQFLKTGAEATSAAVRLARTYTGREHV